MAAMQLEEELASFQNLWKGGYFEGDPLDPMGSSGYGPIGYMSQLHVIYLTCIKPYVNQHSTVLEIGPGRGGWTKTFLCAKEIWCLDALSAEHNNFWQYLGHPGNVKYFQVSDFSCRMLPESKFDYLFSFGCFCHLSFSGITEYMKNIYPKLKSASHCFIMVADYEKYNRALDNLGSLTIARAFPPAKRYTPLRWVWELLWRLTGTNYGLGKKRNVNEDDVPAAGRWYHAGTERTCSMLRELGYEILEADVQANFRDPIIHFTKP